MTAVDARAADQRLSDEDLMLHLAAGRQEALAPLHGRYAPLIFSLAAQTLDPSAAEEVVQDVFLAVWRKAATFDPARGAFRAWVLRMAHLRILNELRGRRRRPRAAPDPDGLQLAALPDAALPPDEAAWHAYRQAAVQVAVDALPPPQRQALRLAFFEDLTHQQVAEFLNLPLGTVKTRIRAGLQKVRPSLAALIAVALLGLVGAAVVQYRAQEEAVQREDRALRMVTVSDSTALRLDAAPGVPAGLHGYYRGRPGVDLAVITVSEFAPAPAGQVYRPWVRRAGVWVALPPIALDAEGRGLLIVEGPAVAGPPEAIQVTLEPVGGGSNPTGPPVVAWSGG